MEGRGGRVELGVVGEPAGGGGAERGGDEGTGVVTARQGGGARSPE